MAGVTTFVLNNKLRVVLCARSTPHKVRVQMLYHFGSNAECCSAERGLAHVVEHMIFKGCLGTEFAQPGMPKRAFQAALNHMALSEQDITATARLFGADFNAFTSTNKTSYYFEVHTKFVIPFLQILSMSMKRTAIKEQHLRSEKRAVLEEMYSGKDDLERQAIMTLRKAIFSDGDPAYHPTIGYESAIVDLVAEQVRAFYDRLYVPQNATLFVVGDLGKSRQDLPITLHRLFGDYDPKPNVPRYVPAKPVPNYHAQTLIKTFHTLDPDAGFTVLVYRSGGATLLSGCVHECIAHVLSGTQNARLQRALVHNGAAHGVRVFAELDSGACETYVEVDHGRDVQLKVVVKAVQNALQQPFTEDELAAFHGAWRLQRAAMECDLEAYTNSWIENFHLTDDVHAFANASPDHPDFMSRLRQCLAEMRRNGPTVVRYTHAPRAKREMEEHATLMQRLDDAKHRRTSASKAQSQRIGAPLANALRGAYRKSLTEVATAEVVKPEHWGMHGKWFAASAPAYTMTRVCCVPYGVIMTREERQTAVLFHEIFTECFPTDAWLPQAMEGGYSGVSFFAAAPADVHDLTDMLRRYTQPLRVREQLSKWWSKHSARKRSQWKHAMAERQRSGRTLAHDWLAQHASDNYLCLADVTRVVEDFDLDTAMDLHDRLWAVSRRLVLAPVLSTLGEGKHGAVEPCEPPGTVFEAGEAYVQLQATESGRLNQAVVCVARPGHLRQTDTRYWAERAVAEIALFHSLGSRLMHHMRELDGDVYTCSGQLGLDANDTCAGFDKITLLVRPGQEEAALHKVREWLEHEAYAPFTTAEVTAAQQILTHKWHRSESQSGFMAHWARWANRRDMAEIVHFPERAVRALNAMTAKQVTAWWAAQAALPWNRSVVVV